MVVTPWNVVSADRSPFVAMFTLTELPAAAGIVNFVVLTSAASSANSGIFSTSAVRAGGARRGPPAICPALAARGAIERPVVFMSVSAGRCGVNLPYSQRHDRVYSGHYRRRHPVYVCVVDYSVFLSGLPPQTSNTAPAFPLQTAAW
uniref:Amino acid permease/ SLC12A domain-containing protein n=1 Tax=Glossina brevipalpis TaxID=37001 RepID=A0A1A9VZ88_9MUSC